MTYPLPPPPPPLGGQPYAPGAYATVPPGPAPGLRYAGFWIRFAAYLIDGVILDIPLGILIAVVLGSALPGLNCTITPADIDHNFRSITCSNLGTLGIPLLIVGTIATAVVVLYFVILWAWLGQTLGQKILGLHVVDANTGTRISYPRALLRLVGVYVASIPFSLGLMWAGWDPRKQGWHDKIAGTYVVKAL